MSDRVYNVLFLCTANASRSILAESILQRDGARRFLAFSAGSHPKGSVNPLALSVLADLHYPVTGFRTKGWEEFARPGAPPMDFVFTVCDEAAGEPCPVWPGHPTTAHWGIADPSKTEGSEIERKAAFISAFRYLRNRISLFVALPLSRIDKLALGTRLREIGHMEGATSTRARAS